MADLARIKRNVSKMVSMDAPESDIDAYIESEGTTIAEVRDFPSGKMIQPAQTISPQEEPGFLEQAGQVVKTGLGLTPFGAVAQAGEAAARGELPEYLGEKAQQAEVALRGTADLPLGVAQAGLEQLPQDLQIPGTDITAGDIRESIGRVTAETARKAEQVPGGELIRMAPQLAQTAAVAPAGLLPAVATSAAMAGFQPTSEVDVEKARQERIESALVGGAIGAAIPGIKIASKFAKKAVRKALSVNPEAVQDLINAGIKPTIANVTESGVLKRVSDILRQTPGSAGRMEMAFKNASDDITRQLNKASVDEALTIGKAGDLIKKGAKGYVDKGKAVANRLYSKVDEQIGLTTKGRTAAVLEAEKDLLEKTMGDPVLAEKFSRGKAAEYINKLKISSEAGGGEVPYGVLKQIRTTVNDDLFDIARGTGALGSADKAALTQLKHALTEDIRGIAASKSDQVLRNYDRANKFYAGFADTVEKNLDNLIKKDGGTVFRALMSDARVEGLKARRVVQQLTQGEKEILGGTIIRDLGYSKAVDGISFPMLASNWNKAMKTHPEVFNAIYKTNKPLKQSMNRLVKGINKMSGFLKDTNPSGTAYTAAIAALGTGSVTGGGIPILYGLAGAHITSRMLTSPTFVKWMADLTTKAAQRPGFLTRHLPKLAAISAGNPELRPDIENFLDQMGGNIQ